MVGEKVSVVQLRIRRTWRSAHFVGFVVVLRVVFEYLGFLDVVEVAHQVVDTKFFSPFLAVNEPRRFRHQFAHIVCNSPLWNNSHLLGEFDVEFARSEKTQLFQDSVNSCIFMSGLCKDLLRTRCLVFRCILPAPIASVVGELARLALASYGRDARFGCLGWWWDNHSGRIWDRA